MMRFVLLCLATMISGAAAIAYELLWIRRLGEIFGHTTYAVNIVLAIFFSGLGVGAWWLGKLADRTKGSILLFSILELVIAVCGLVFLSASQVLAQYYLSLVPAEWPLAKSLTLKAVGSLALLGIPAIAMGGTLPALTRHIVQGSSQLAARLGWLYGLNTLGAAVGVVAVVFVLIPKLGIPGAFGVAAAGNLVAALLAFVGRLRLTTATSEIRARRRPEKTKDPTRTLPNRRDLAILLGAAALSGFVSVSFQVLWTRALASRFLSTIYSFAGILFVFLLCLGLGSVWVSLLDRLDLVKRTTCALVMIGSGVAGIISVYLLQTVPLSLSFQGLGESFAHLAARELGYALLVFSLPTLLFGLNLPLIVHMTHREVHRVGGELGRVYLANTIGSVLAPLLVGFLVLPAIGLKGTLLTTAWAGVLFGVVVLLPWSQPRRQTGRALAALALIVPGLLTFLLPEDIRFWKQSAGDRLIDYREGVSASVAVVEESGGDLVLKVNNQYELGGTRGRFAQQRQGLIPLLLHPNPARGLLIGLGTGSSAGAAAGYGGLGVDIVEIVPDLKAMLPHFDAINGGLSRRLSQSPDLRLLEVDARDFVWTTRGRYDVIIGDLFVPWRSGEGTMYTREHFQAVQQALSDNGLFCQWLPLYQLGAQELRTIVATFCSVFPEVSAWWLYFNVQEPVIGLIGSKTVLALNATALEKRLADAARQRLLVEAGLGDVRPLLGSWIAGRSALLQWAGDAPLETCARPRIEFLAPLGTPVLDAARAAQNISSLLSMVQPIQGSNWARTASAERLAEIARYQRAVVHALRGQFAAVHRKVPSAALDEYVAALQAAPDWGFVALLIDASVQSALREKQYGVASTGASLLKTIRETAYLGYYYAAIVALAGDDRAAAINSLGETLKLAPDHQASRRLLEKLTMKPNDHVPHP